MERPNFNTVVLDIPFISHNLLTVVPYLAAKYGTTVGKLCEMNGISKTTVLKLGRSIRCK